MNWNKMMQYYGFSIEISMNGILLNVIWIFLDLNVELTILI